MHMGIDRERKQAKQVPHIFVQQYSFFVSCVFFKSRSNASPNWLETAGSVRSVVCSIESIEKWSDIIATIFPAFPAVFFRCVAWCCCCNETRQFFLRCLVAITHPRVLHLSAMSSHVRARFEAKEQHNIDTISAVKQLVYCLMIASGTTREKKHCTLIGNHGTRPRHIMERVIEFWRWWTQVAVLHTS